MSEEAYNDRLRKSPIASNVVVDETQITLFGVAKERIDQVWLLKVKKRRTNKQYLYPLMWTNEQWTVSFSIEENEFSKGVWDFYLYDDKEQADYRIKIENEEKLISCEGFYNLSNKTLRFRLYRTVKESLSFTVKAADITLQQLKMIKKGYDNWMIKIKGNLQDHLEPLFSVQHQFSIILVQRQTFEEIEIPVQRYIEENILRIDFNLDYRELIDFNNIVNSTWDCYLRLKSHQAVYSFRLHVDSENVDAESTVHSLKEFKAGYIYQVYFYHTINHNLSVKLHRARAKQSIEKCSIDPEYLYLQGFGFLDIHDPQPHEAINRSIVIRKRASDNEIPVELPGQQEDTTKESNRYNIQIPLKNIVDFETVEKETFDIAMQYRQANAVYESKLGFEPYTYVRDGILDGMFIKNKDHYTRLYLTLTPNGNLKIETFYLTKLSYLYLKFGQTVDRKLNNSKNIWLIGERANTAQDTGYHFFKYCREHHPEIDVYYVINSESKDIENIKPLGNVLYTGTLKHVHIASIASVFIGSHDLDNILPLKGLELDNYVHGNRVFIQHGVMGRKNVEYHKKYYRDPFHLFCVSSIPEKKLVENKLGYDANEVKITGLSRFDALLESHEERRSILLMPTWRDWLGHDESFKRSMYYDYYTSLLKNETLQALLEEYNFTLDFYPHHRMQPFIEQFKPLKSDRVNIIELGEKTVQQLLKENKLMITDYSSVSFDFNYMSKPIIFYHFDEKAFFKNGLLRPKSETFLGDICKREEEVIEAVKYYIEHDFTERKEMYNEKHQVFSYIDKSNNQRIFNEIMKLQG